MNKIIKISLASLFIIFAIALIFYIYWPFADGFINQKRTVGDALMHLANVISFQRNHPFPIMAWKTEWAGYPVIEGYPWLHYYIIQPLLSLFSTPGLAMDYYSAIFLLVYYILSFLLLFYVSKNAFLALFFSLVLVYGADSQMPFTVNAFMTFTASMFLLPLILLTTGIARQKNSMRLFVLSSMILSLSFYSHGAMTGIVIFPTIFPFLILDKYGKISKESILRTLKYFSVFALLSSVQIYQFISYNAQGYLRGVKPFPLSDIPARLQYLFSWQNPVLLPLVLIFIPLFIFAVRKSYSQIKPYLFSFIFIFFIFTLMVFNITSMNLVLLAERMLWGLSLVFLFLFAKVVRELTKSGLKRSVVAGAVFFITTALYLYFTLVIKPPHLVPETLRAYDPYLYHIDEKTNKEQLSLKPYEMKYSSKYDLVYSYPPLSWDKGFNNYRADGISYNIYSNWNIWSSNPRYKGRFPAAKGLPLEWSGLVTASEYGLLGEAGTPDDSIWAINQVLFFFDWYAIRHFEIAEMDSELAEYLRKEPLITSTERSLDLIYHSIDKKFIGPIYTPTNAKTMAVVSPKIQYDNFIRTLSYSEFTSKRLIPIYLGSSLRSINKENLKYFDSVFLYGYNNPILSGGKWELLADYVKNGGKLIVETGQKVGETESVNLPEVFPIKTTKMTGVSKPWKVGVSENELTTGINMADFTPLKTKYLPYSISEAKPEFLKNWAKEALGKDGSIVLAFGQLGKGSVVWSGLNLPFHAIDNRNTSETLIFANILDWFFPEIEAPITDFELSHSKPEEIIVKSSQGKGVLLKENYNPGWWAKLNGKKVKIFKAGLFEMYIPFASTEGGQVVELNYYGAPIHWVLFLVSTTSLIGTFIYLFFNKNPLLWINKLTKLNINIDEEDN